MTAFKRKPVVIDAVQYAGAGNMNPRGGPPDWLWDALDSGVAHFTNGGDPLRLRTLNGEVTCAPHDWIIRGIQGELYPCAPDIFEATYEPAASPAAAPPTKQVDHHFDPIDPSDLFVTDCKVCGKGAKDHVPEAVYEPDICEFCGTQEPVGRCESPSAARDSPEAQMIRDEHLLVIAIEECNELAQRLSKALRFGLEEIQPGQPFTNTERIRYEYSDLAAVLEMIAPPSAAGGIIHPPSGTAMDAKREKVERFLTYSAEVGTLAAARPRSAPPGEKENTKDTKDR